LRITDQSAIIGGQITVLLGHMRGPRFIGAKARLINQHPTRLRSLDFVIDLAARGSSRIARADIRCKYVKVKSETQMNSVAST
jgi:hypothetical protein